MNNFKAITHIPGWFELLQTADKIPNEGVAYASVPLVFRALRLRCDSLSQAPVIIYSNDTEVEWPFKTSLSKLLWATEASLMLTGGAYWLKVANRVVVKDVMHLNPYSMSVEYDERNQRFEFVQRVGASVNQFSQDDIVYFREYDPFQDIEPGIAPVSVALEDAREMKYMTRFASKFFEHGAMPVTVLGIEQVSDTELKRVEGVFNRMMSNIRNAFKIIAVRANAVDIKTLTPPIKDLAMPELYEQTKKNIANAFGVPVTMLEDPAANRATAGVHHFSFWSETIRPRGEVYEDVINNQLFGGTNLSIRFDWDSLDVFQEDEAQRSSSLLNLVNARIPADVAVQILGFELTDEQLARIAEAQQERDEQREAIVENTQPDKPKIDDENDEEKSIRGELLRWRKNALTRLSQNRPAAKLFKSDVIPIDVTKRIYTLLRMAKSPDDVEKIFDAFLRDSAFEFPDVGEFVDAIRRATEAISDGD